MSVNLLGNVSGSTLLQAQDAASGTLTLPATTDTLVGKNTTDVLTNKTYQSPIITQNLTFSGTGNRITGDFSNATVANRVMFQTSVVNGVTALQVMPNGTATQSQLACINGTDPNNASGVQIRVNATEATLMGYNTGTGVSLPLTFYTGGAERVRIDTSGNVGIGQATWAFNNKVNIKQAADNSAGGFGLKIERNANDSCLFAGYRDNTDSWQVNATYVSTGAHKPITFHTGDAERVRIDTSGNLLITSTAGLGYGTGAGGTVTQATSKSTAVTLNKPCGQITMNNAALAAGASVSFQVNNSLISGTQENVLVTISDDVTTIGSYRTQVTQIRAGSFYIILTNITGSSQSNAVVLNFAILKGATS
jgi:hypothetical protein